MFGSCVIGVLLSGLVTDGIEGLGEIKRRGGTAIVQKPVDAVFPEAPLTALQDGIQIDYVLSPSE